MSLPRPSTGRCFTHLDARITQENGVFMLGIQLRNRLVPEDFAGGLQEAVSIEMASEMIAGVAQQFGILQPAISISIFMENFKDGTRH